MRKILYSPGYGAGWSSWNEGEVAKYMLTYQPIIDFLEKGGKASQLKETHPLLKQLQQECKDTFGVDYVCVLGADDLRVATVPGRVRIEVYHGFESYVCEGYDEGWM